MEEEVKQKQEKDWCEEILSQVESQIEEISNEKINSNNVEYLYRLVDIHKDLKNEEYWKEKINMYNDGSYGRGSYNAGSYNEGYGARGVPGTGRGSYREGSYGRRGVPGSGRGRYRGEEMMNEMYEAYNDYMDSQEYGNYGTSESMMKIEVMAESLMDFVKHLKKEAKSPEEKQLIQQKIQELSRM